MVERLQTNSIRVDVWFVHGVHTAVAVLSWLVQPVQPFHPVAHRLAYVLSLLPVQQGMSAW